MLFSSPGSQLNFRPKELTAQFSSLRLKALFGDVEGGLQLGQCPVAGSRCRFGVLKLAISPSVHQLLLRPFSLPYGDGHGFLHGLGLYVGPNELFETRRVAVDTVCVSWKSIWKLTRRQPGPSWTLSLSA